MSQEHQWWRQLRASHQFLASHAFYSLALSTTLAISLLSARNIGLHTNDHAWFVWNIFLAWIPYLASLWADSLHQHPQTRPWHLIVPTGLWIVFLPNAPYLITDFMHIRQRPDMPWLFWYDMILMATFAWTGCILGAFSLSTMQRIIRDYSSSLTSWLFVLASAGLCGIGLYLGRFERWNSWDILLHPKAIAYDLINPILDPIGHLRPLAISALFSAFFLISYLTIATKPTSDLNKPLAT